MLDPGETPRLHAHVRLQWEPVQKAYVLLYPEGMVRLNEAAAAVLQCCDGQTTVPAIIRKLQEDFDGDEIAHDVEYFLATALTEGWIILTSNGEEKPLLAAR